MFWLFLDFIVVSGCGMTTHDLIAHRAVQYYFSSHWPQYTDIIQEFPDAIQGGAPFPDYLYECGTDHDAGEAAHWPPFHAAAANVIRSRPKPWNNATRQLVAFFFGVISHYIADVNWHGLFPTKAQNGYGFIQTLGTQDFNCSGDLCPVAHGAADTGGEFVAAYTTNLSYSDPAKWIVPTKDLIEIFAQPGVNKTVTAESIERCKALFIVGSIATKDVGELVYYEETSNAPFLQEMYIDHPLGGVDDMAVWTGRMINRFESWLENGPPSPLPPDPLIGYPRSPSSRFRSHLIKAFSAVHVDLSAPVAQKQQVYRKALAAFINKSEETLSRTTADALVLKRLKSLLKQLELATERTPAVRRPVLALSPILEGNSSLGYLGSALASGDIDGDGQIDVVVSAYGTSTVGYPQRGATYVQFGGSSDVIQILGTDIFGRFGWAVVVLDFNLDGLMDIVASSPTQGWNWTVDNIENVPDWRYFGSVSVYFGNSKRQFGSEPDVVISTQVYLTHFGTYLNAVDVDEDGEPDLVVGSPLSRGAVNSTGIQRGSLRVFFSSSKRATGQRLQDSDAEASLFGSDDFAQFGHSAVIAQAGGCATMLLVGAPFFHVNQSAYGRVTSFHKGQLLFTLTANVKRSKFGSVGAVYLFDQVDLAQMASDGGDYTVSQQPLKALVSGSALGARFGWQVMWTPLANQEGDALLITAPLHSNLGLSGHQDGAVFVWKQDALPSGYVLDVKANFTALGVSSGGRLGSALAVINRTLLIGAPRAQSFKFHVDTPGALFAFNIV